MKILTCISKRRLESFLVWFANLHPSFEAADKLKQNFPEFIPKFAMNSAAANLLRRRLSEMSIGLGWSAVPSPIEYSMARVIPQLQERMSEEDFETLGRNPDSKIPGLLLLLLSDFIQQAWWVPELRERDWKLFLARKQIWALLMPAGWEAPLNAPPRIPLEEAVFHLQSEERRARRCGNTDCPAPFFFANRKNQKFCRDECAAPAKSAAKKRWWEERGIEWRQQRREHGKR
jgi:hypothetical protein